MPDTPPLTWPDERCELARRQAALVAALRPGACASAPDGFDAAALTIARTSLARKRMRAVEKTWPALTGSLGERFSDAFAQFRCENAVCDDAGLDGYRFALWLSRRGMLTDNGRVERIRWEVTRGGFVRVAWLRDSHCLIIAFRWCGPRLARLRLF
jgi:hypothetical protein